MAVSEQRVRKAAADLVDWRWGNGDKWGATEAGEDMREWQVSGNRVVRAGLKAVRRTKSKTLVAYEVTITNSKTGKSYKFKNASSKEKMIANLRPDFSAKDITRASWRKLSNSEAQKLEKQLDEDIDRF